NHFREGGRSLAHRIVCLFLSEAGASHRQYFITTRSLYHLPPTTYYRLPHTAYRLLLTFYYLLYTPSSARCYYSIEKHPLHWQVLFSEYHGCHQCAIGY